MPREFEKPDTTGGPFRLGDWLVEPSLNRLSRGDTTIQLELKVMDVLVCLAGRAGEVVTRQEIVDTVWATEFIADNTLTHAITEIRNALGDDARNPSFIETIHRRGYRLIVPVEPTVSDEAGESRVARFPVPERAARPEKDRSPYPGLAAFTEADSEFFFGREDEVAKMWRKLTSRRLLAVIGPSGVGKSSFIRAGVMASKPDGWNILYCQPGEAPFTALARALVPEFEGDGDAISNLVHLSEPEETVAMVSRWRDRCDQALLIVDQFEELFTLNSAEVQARFADLLRLLVDQADIHLLLSMRDDFLHQCQPQASLAPVFEDLTPIGQPDGGALRRALTAPAEAMGFRFEDYQIPEEMAQEVEGERGALPLLAFSISRLWDTRDREQKLLTQQAYSDIGGVAGALARHADATLKAIGDERLPIVREVFRNLVTAQGTRAVRSVDDLLTVFSESQRDAAYEVLRRLIDARLLTSFEEEGIDADRHRRVEVVHESLLSSWPRLVRWQTQDADAAQVRDQLRQAARTWEEHDHVRDYLWTGKAYREFSVWRENYPGGLTELEEDFATAMTNHAKRRKRRRRVAVAAAFVVLLAGLTVVGSFWQRSTHEARRAEAANQVSLGQLELDFYPSATVAHAIASLELADSQAARRLALEALWLGPTALVVNDLNTWWVRFSADGDRMVQSTGGIAVPIHVIDKNGEWNSFDTPPEWGNADIFVDPPGKHLLTKRWATSQAEQHLILWSIPDGEKLAEARYEAPAAIIGRGWNEDRALLLIAEDGEVNLDTMSFDGTIERLALPDLDFNPRQWYLQTAIDLDNGQWLAVIDDGTVMVHKILDEGLSPPRILGRHDGEDVRAFIDPRGQTLATKDSKGTVRLWDIEGESPPRVVQFPAESYWVGFAADGNVLTTLTYEEGRDHHWAWSMTATDAQFLRKIDTGLDGMGFENWDSAGLRLARCGPDRAVRIWSLAAPADAQPTVLLRGDVGRPWDPRFHPSGKLIATADEKGLAVWPLTRAYPLVIRKHGAPVRSVAFDPRGQWLVSGGVDENVRLWPLAGKSPEKGRILFDGSLFDITNLAVSPDSEQLLAGSVFGPAVVVPVDGSTATVFDEYLHTDGVAIGPGGKAALVASLPENNKRDLYVYDATSWQQPRKISFEVGVFSNTNPRFSGENHILAVGSDKVPFIAELWRIDLQTENRDVLFQSRNGGSIREFAVSQDEARIALVELNTRSHGSEGPAVILDLEANTARTLESHGDQVLSIDLDLMGNTVVTGSADGTIRVGPTTGEEPHLLLGHEGRVWSVAIDPLGRWIASGGEDGTVRLWPMPDLSKPPLHTLPHDELIAKLKTLTNLRVVRDEESATGWKLTHDPFPGWETVPEW